MEQPIIANGGLQFVPQIAVQYVYLDFDGELTSYNGEILTIEEVNVEDSKITKARIDNILAELNARYTEQNVIFVTERPTSADYSTIYIGKTEAFSPYGNFAGLAETIDAGNKNKTDKAFVMLDSTASNEAIISTISHETDHLLGTLTHGGEALAAYADYYVVEKGERISGVTLHNDSMYVEYGGLVNNITVSDGYIYVSNGGVAFNTILNSYGSIAISGIAYNTTVNYYGTVIVRTLGIASNVIMNGGTRLDIDDGGIVENLTILSPTCKIGTWYHTGIDSAHITSMTGNGLVGTATNLNGSGSLTILDGGVANNTVVSSRGEIYVYDGGVANNTVVRGGIFISNGGVAKNTTVDSYYGSVCIYSGGDVYDTVISDGTMYIKSAGNAKNVIISDGGAVVISSGGIASNISAVDEFGHVWIAGGSGINISACDVTIYDGGRASNIELENGNTLSISDGSANNTIVNSNSYLHVSSNGLVHDIIVKSAGYLSIDHGGSATNITIVDGGLLSLWVDRDTYAQGTSNGNVFTMKDGLISNFATNGYIHITWEGQSENIILNSGGYMPVNGVANSTTVKSDSIISIEGGGNANNTLLNGRMDIWNTGIANNTVVNSGGTIEILANGFANFTTVNYGGELYIDNYYSGEEYTAATIDGLSVAGEITFEEDRDCYLKNVGVIDFNISVRSEDDGVILSDWSRVINDDGACYNITVSPEQADGEYKLIGNVTNFDFAITVKDDSGKYYQEISLEDPVVTIGDAEFRLKLDEEEKVLSLVVDNDLSDQVLERLARNSNVNGRYVFPDTIYNVPQIRSKKRGDIIEFELNNKKYYFKFDALFDDNNYSGFFAMGLLQCDKEGKESGNAILVCQGTQGDTIGTDQANEGITDIFADLNPNGIGYGQSQSQAFAAAVAWINRYQKNGDKTYVTGQSLGAAAAQMAASKAGEIYKLVTFNPPGIATSFADVSADQVVHYVDSGDMVSMGGRKYVESINGDTTVNIVQTGFILGNDSNQGNYQIPESNFAWLLALHDSTFLSIGSSSMDYTPNSVDRDIIYSTDSTAFLEADNFSYLHLPYNAGSIKQDYQGTIITGKDGSKFFFNSDYARFALRLAWGNVTVANRFLTRERSESGRALTGKLLEIAQAAKPAIIYYAVTHPVQTLSIAAVALTLKVTLDHFGDKLYDFFINRGIYKKAYDSTNITIGDKSLVNSHDKSGKDYRTVDLDSDNVPDLIYNITDRRFEALEYVDPILSFAVNPASTVGFTLRATIDKAFGWVAIKMPLLAYAAYKITSTATGNTSLDGNIVKKGNSLYLLDDPATEYTINFTRDLSVTAEKGIISFTEDEITADTTSITVYASDIDMSKTVGGSNDTLTLTISVGDREKSVVLQETAVEGIFSGTIAVNQKDSIAIYAGETLTASYTDSNAGNQQTCTISQEISAAFNDIAVELTKIIADDYTADYKVDQWSSFHILLDKEDVASGKYLIAKNVSNFSNDITLYHINTDKPVAVKPNSGNVALGNKKYSVELQDGNLMLNLDYLTIDSTQAGASRFSWQSEAQSFIAGITKNNFTQELRIKLSGMSISTYGMAEGSYKWRVKIEGSSNWYISNDFKAEKSVDPQKFVSDADGDMDVFFAENKGTWSSNYSAQHQGIKDGWKGSGEQVKLAGKNIIADVFVGSSDANVLVLTDSANGDALFVDDIYTALPGTVAEQQARIAQIDEIRAGAGDDIVDMTSQRFIYIGDGVKIYGGDDNDTLWANNGSNTLFGDAGNDRIVGGANNDVIVGGIGNDSMHGGGGSDIFCFGGDWGTDTVEQLANGSVTLWFEEGSESNWDADTLTYTDGANSVTVSGVTNITLRFGADSSLPAGCFDDAVSEKIFEDKTKGLLA